MPYVRGSTPATRPRAGKDTPPVRRPDVPLRSAGGRLMRIRLTAAGREWAAVTRRERAGDQRVAGYCARAAKTALS
jgi:hypothetical protein